MSDAKRERLSSNLLKQVQFHFHKFTSAELAAFTVERQKTSYPKAKSDLMIFNGEGLAVLKGREFSGSQISLWE